MVDKYINSILNNFSAQCRMLVYEFVNNGNLEQWLHGEVGPYSPLTWEIRMNIILGTAKGYQHVKMFKLLFSLLFHCPLLICKFCRLSYLHEGLEPKVIHRDIKSSNILLDKHWNSKVADFGLAKLLGSERSYTTTRVMGTFGYAFVSLVLSLICVSRYKMCYEIMLLNFAATWLPSMPVQAC